MAKSALWHHFTGVLIALPIGLGGTILRHYNFRAFEFFMFGGSVVLTLFACSLVYGLWPTKAQRLNENRGAAYAGVVAAGLILSLCLYGTYILLPVVTG